MNSEAFLSDLADKLREIKRRKLATQQHIARETGVDQPTISRFMNGRKRRVNEKARKLMNYADMLLTPDRLSSQVREAARAFLRRGGTEAELIASIEHSANLVFRRLRKS